MKFFTWVVLETSDPQVIENLFPYHYLMRKIEQVEGGYAFHTHNPIGAIVLSLILSDPDFWGLGENYVLNTSDNFYHIQSGE